LVAASNCERSPYSGFPKYFRPQLQATHSNCSQLNLSSSLTNSVTHQPTNLHSTAWPNPKSKLRYDRQPVDQSVLVSNTNLRPKTRFLLVSDNCGFVDMGRPLCREDGSVIYNRCLSSPAQSFSDPSPTELMITFYCLRFAAPPTWRARSPYLNITGTEWTSYTPRHWVLFSSPPTTRRVTVEVFEPISIRGWLSPESELLYDWRFTANQLVLAPSPLRFTTRDYFSLNPYGHSPYESSSMGLSLMNRLHLCQEYVSHIQHSIGLHGYGECLLFPGSGQSNESDNL
jgi:hypothetical protein